MEEEEEEDRQTDHSLVHSSDITQNTNTNPRNVNPRRSPEKCVSSPRDIHHDAVTGQGRELEANAKVTSPVNFFSCSVSARKQSGLQ